MCVACYFGGDYVNLVEGGRRRIANLNVGDRIWTLSSDGQSLIEDEIFCIPHVETTTPSMYMIQICKNNCDLAYFYTFTTTKGDRISLTDSHYILVYDQDEKNMKFLPASKVTLTHQLIMKNRTISMKKIVYSVHIGFYSPITLSGYLLVNNLSTSVYSEV